MKGGLALFHRVEHQGGHLDETLRQEQHKAVDLRREAKRRAVNALL
jgi:hypothetical protein